MRVTAFLPGLALLALPSFSTAQSPYFPAPVAGSNWETTDPANLGWCQDRIDSLYAFLDAHHTKGFMVLKDGRIVLEHYFGTFVQDSLWYWASAGKTLTSTVVGIAQEEGYLDINAPTDTYLGAGWTSESPVQEALITVRNQLTMTSGLDDGVSDVDCTDPTCLTYIADAGDRWAYHNAPYTLLQEVVANATGQNFTLYFNARLRNPIGMDGFWVPVGDKNVYFSTLRSMARFGLLASNRMVWDADTILHDAAYFDAATTPSQSLNPSYGYLWWLNGQSSYMLPTTQFIFPGPLMPEAPADMYSGLGKNDQLLNVVPGRGLVLVRMGDAAGTSLPVATVFNNVIWQYMNALDCNTAITEDHRVGELTLVPNPCTDKTRILLPPGAHLADVELYDVGGRLVHSARNVNEVDVSKLASGVYSMKVAIGADRYVSRLVKE
ncbi:MAG: serine hydrolase [Flavobacteriales bacterium]|jgi:CubicO group peptidase (beta-lactamase class C family)|nr:serine hydrolase [Flavobacteriales bacterium]MCB0758919.1 serine hydrolase [Flavobacteriales bacterium]